MPSGVYERKSVIERILSKIKKVNCPTLTTSCWNYTGATDRRGYGKIGRKGKIVRVPRYIYWYYFIKPLGTSWEEFSESCSDLDVCHHCDNPKCCNPKHLFLGTRKDNSQDMIKKGRQAKGEDKGTSKLTEKQVLKIYRMEGTQQVIADKFGITPSAVSCIKTGKNWGWLTHEMYKG